MKQFIAIFMLAWLMIPWLHAFGSNINEDTIGAVIAQLHQKYGENADFRIGRGVRQVASFWSKEDGLPSDFENFCLTYFIADDKKLDLAFEKISRNLESIFGHANKTILDLKSPLDLEMGEVDALDEMFGSYDPGAHFSEDFFKNKIAFYIVLNFPFYSLQEKSMLGTNWSRKEWAYARIGDIFTARIPAEVLQKVTEIMTGADMYIAQYNIYMGNLVDESGKTYFPKDLKLISHWGLRDELKSHYGQEAGLGRQRMIYQVMRRIISQEIPENMINKNDLTWNPVSNKLYKDGQATNFKSEPDARYQQIVSIFQAMRAIDPYTPQYPTFIKRNFEKDMEIPQEQIEELFVKMMSAPQVKKVGELISKRLGRNLEPFDIWYDGFKARSSISQAELDKVVNQKYPSREAYAKDLPNIFVKLGFSQAKAEFIASKIEVDSARGAGHAWGAEMRSEKAHLRTRIGPNGMNYKGYNIATHEVGHNVEQTLTLQNVDYYMLKGVPNNAFTEAWAFAFQKRDLELLGMPETNPDKRHLYALDHFWGTFEIMGVSLVDMRAWKWLYDHPQATAAELKAKMIEIAIEVWNQFYAPVFGVKDEPVLAIYSHMIAYPLYLPAYPLGHLIELQIACQVEGKNLATEMERMCVQGRLIPQLWMKGAVGNEISIQPTLDVVDAALKAIK